ncbi:ABC transporter substrate-binding protein [Isachenkonia alkalipeptolytica]|uniref:ABC transporter substrate-binding protein n=1 Tax=Isachenkonia alkalipeptolytica TaxID=2565777 RepID=A0AA43XKH2_9CLOT|nr:ABC transporter substrate-binding protein [Isachenkonia alkalipeptolytica]NBG88312.1 ABC transporter substrate-binding protein [Isachenkonia alkalipeptolytica]
MIQANGKNTSFKKKAVRNKVLLGIIAVLLLGVLAGCEIGAASKEEVNIGYFPNLSHAGGIVGMSEGIYQDALEDYNVKEMTFPNGSLFMDSLSTGQIDIGFVGPGPVLNRYLQGGEVVILGNSTNAGNVLVLREGLEYNGPEDLAGLTIATASTGCTHDLLLRKMLDEEGMAVEENGGTVKRLPQRPATNIGMMEQGQIDGALVSEPWASMMEAQGVGEVVVEFDEVPWEGEVPATVIAARRDFVEENPDIVEAFLKAHEESVAFVNENEEESIEILQSEIKRITDQELEFDTLKSSLNRVVFTPDLDQQVVTEFAELLTDLGFVDSDRDLQDIFWER